VLFAGQAQLYARASLEVAPPDFARRQHDGNRHAITSSAIANRKRVVVSATAPGHRDERKMATHDGVQWRTQQQLDGAVAGAVPESKWGVTLGHTLTVACRLGRRVRERRRPTADELRLASVAPEPPVEHSDRRMWVAAMTKATKECRALPDIQPGSATSAIGSCLRGRTLPGAILTSAIRS
jgi:hypothetical protein